MVRAHWGYAAFFLELPRITIRVKINSLLSCSNSINFIMGSNREKIEI